MQFRDIDTPNKRIVASGFLIEMVIKSVHRYFWPVLFQPKLFSLAMFGVKHYAELTYISRWTYPESSTPRPCDSKAHARFATSRDNDVLYAID